MSRNNSEQLASEMLERLAALDAAWPGMVADAGRYRWLRAGGWEVMQDPKYWRPEYRFDGAIDAGIADVALNAAMEASRG